MADLLDSAGIEDALASMPGWAHGEDKLTKVVEVAAADQEALERAVMQVADELNHHPGIERSSGGMTFRLWTHSAGGVTAKDVELAARIDRVLSGSTQQ